MRREKRHDRLVLDCAHAVINPIGSEELDRIAHCSATEGRESLNSSPFNRLANSGSAGVFDPPSNPTSQQVTRGARPCYVCD